MASAVPRDPTGARKQYKLGVNSYDRASSLLVSLLIIVGIAVGALMIIFFARRLISMQVAIPVTAVDPASRPADAAMGLAQDPEPPGLEDAPELEEPELMDTLNALSDALSSKSALLSDEMFDAESQIGKGSGLGDNREAGDGGTGEARPEPRRQINFNPADLEDYANWMDTYKLELAVWGRDEKIYYASNLRKPQPDTRVGTGEDENRFRMSNSGGPLEPLDRRLATKAQIVDKGNIIVHYYPPETEGMLLGLEKQAAKGRPIEQIRMTVFRVEREGAGFEFRVENQIYY